MILKLKKSILLAIVLFFSALALNPAPIGYAQESAGDKAPARNLNCDDAQTAEEAIRCGANEVGGNTDTGEAESLNDTIEQIVNILTAIVGVIAVIMVIVAGFRYITSGGDANRIKSAKDTLLYAIIGLIIVALAQIIVRFVLNNVTG